MPRIQEFIQTFEIVFNMSSDLKFHLSMKLSVHSFLFIRENRNYLTFEFYQIEHKFHLKNS